MIAHFVLTKEAWTSVHPKGTEVRDLHQQKLARFLELEMADIPCVQGTGHCLMIGSEDSL